mmetsp:Transcript_20343/g.39966  ORF Transcript_20343/g.39966 Transcript_20343/m.39966 type:complete len:487 (+) Transcript_20343:641-2101(+)|eukprot:CAMPEP_0171567248 /NCGR_PEP_ID=MMETSP0961-20121227/1054_1 /TAXON_ID=87120 /ORGANISM="Aurantiochytrium limacinum, Strain ATCCMYA-1381" /LENGTH=486 /DNA_ID=CAMNT_0012121147 /DNA_START=578 /DNA_END=2038 /DNA_ORIENTATION=+
MGCTSSSLDQRVVTKDVGSPIEEEDDQAPGIERSSGGSTSSSKSKSSEDLMHTNSMLFSKDTIEEAKQSIRLKKPIGGALAEALAHDPAGVLMASDPVYELGMEVEYPVEMKETMTLQLLKLKKGYRHSFRASKRVSKLPEHHSSEDYESGVDTDDEHAVSLSDVESELGYDIKDVSTQDILEKYEVGHKLLFGYKSLRGRSNAQPLKLNQDSLVAFIMDGKPNQAVFGIFDGHGPFGEHASHFCRMELHKTMKAVYEEFGDDLSPQDVLEHSIGRLHEAFIHTDLNYTGVDPQVSGTTLVVAMIVDSEIYVANVGDSRCIMGEMDEEETKGQVVVMSDDHKPERQDEYRRILRTSAVLMSEGELRGAHRQEGKTYICRRRDGDIIYGVLFTRSIGDLDAHDYLGVSAEPEFKHDHIHKNIKQYLVLASDGVWDQMTNEEVLAKIYNAKDPLAASKQIVEAARQRWDIDPAHSRRDDISAVVVQLE